MSVPNELTAVDLAVMSRLKRATSDHHAKAESALDAILSLRAPTRATYAAALMRLAGWYQPLEDAIAPLESLIEAVGIDWRRRRKSSALSHDLAKLGCGRVEICDRLPPLDDVPSVLGCLYVTEGATLGGRIIVRAVGPALGVTAEEGARFFGGYNADTGTLWRRFGSAVTAYVEANPAMGEHQRRADIVVRSAQDTFESLTRWLRICPIRESLATS